jgi:hypothetical protein
MTLNSPTSLARTAALPLVIACARVVFAPARTVQRSIVPVYAILDLRSSHNHPPR